MVWSPRHTRYPPVLPILLFPSTLLHSYSVGKFIILSLFMLSLFFSYRLFQTLYDNSIPEIALIILAVSPSILQFSHWILSEIPYILFSILTIYLWVKKKYTASLLFAVITFFTRTIGIALLFVVALFYFIKFKGKPKKLFPLLFLIFPIAWFVYGHFVVNPYKVSYMKQMLIYNPYKPELGNVGFWGLAMRILMNICLLVSRIFSQMFLGKIGPYSPFFGIVILDIISVGIFKCKREGIFKLINLYSLLYLIAIWIYPLAWSGDRRFYLPLLPFIALWIGIGLKEISVLIKKKKFPFIMAYAFGLYSIFLGFSSFGETWGNNINWIKYKIPPKEASYFKTYLSIKEKAEKKKIPKGTIFLIRKKRAFYYFTGFPAICPWEIQKIKEQNNNG